ncbi:MAG: ATP-binding cassette domain-containing protein, partial [Pseudomonadota bacterium]
PGTVRENLCLDSQFDDKQLKEVLSRVELLPWLHSLPFGLDTEMSDYPPLSGGEAQRLSLARILLRNDDVWLLDEPTAHLSDSQHQRLANLIYTLSKNRTVVWASHKALPAEWFNGFWNVKDSTVLSTSSVLTSASGNHNA